jgi:hypothetical protein
MSTTFEIPREFGPIASFSVLSQFETGAVDMDDPVRLEETSFRKKSLNCVVLTLDQPMKSSAVEVDGRGAAFESASLLPTLEATDIEEEERSGGIRLYQFRKLDSCSEVFE